MIHKLQNITLLFFASVFVVDAQDIKEPTVIKKKKVGLEGELANQSANPENYINDPLTMPGLPTSIQHQNAVNTIGENILRQLGKEVSHKKLLAIATVWPTVSEGMTDNFLLSILDDLNALAIDKFTLMTPKWLQSLKGMSFVERSRAIKNL